MIRFNSAGLLAIDARALGEAYDPIGPGAGAHELRNGYAIVCVDGPLSYSDQRFETYARIKAGVQAALADSGAQAVILKINSPGGDVAGCFDTARALRAMAHAAGKPLIAFSDAKMLSAAYALGSAADRIVISDTAEIGSIGVIVALADLSRQNEALGVTFNLIHAGARKTDGHPAIPLSDQARSAIQTRVDDQAAVFWALVSGMRGMPANTVQGFEAGIFDGARAVASKLADEIASLDELVARPFSASLPIPQAEATSAESGALAQSNSMAEQDNDKPNAIRKALADAIAGEDKDEAAKALKALKAYDKANESGDDEKKEPEGKASDEEKDAKAKAESDEEKAKASAAATAPLASVTALAAELAAVKASNATLQAAHAASEAKAQAAERQALFDSRPDLSAEFKATLAGISNEQLGKVLAAIPKLGVPNSAQPTLGNTQGGPAGPGDPALALKMGVLKMGAPTTKYDEHTGVQYLGVSEAYVPVGESK